MGSGGSASRGLTTAAALLFAACHIVWAAQAQAACAPETLDLRGAGSVARFHVEIADTVAERNRGLMFRDTLASSAGMLFVYDEPQDVSFWMKNTLIPLDMIFADATGQVRRVHEGAVPGDLTPIPGGADIQFVLEINAGMAKRLGIAEGAEMRHPAIPAEKAVWPCE
ncbi:MAG: hypothetical protein CFE34_16580 [Rhodobacteraceae bacterium PARR1]|nr:MAG: hypothetical protein CFE34_16580 [Rhodobacteraceae bacterium PARR1]